MSVVDEVVGELDEQQLATLQARGQLPYKAAEAELRRRGPTSAPSRLALGLFKQPWAITRAGLELAIAVASRDEFFAEARQRALSARDGQPLDNTRETQVRDGVAVIPVRGVLVRHATMLTDISGATSYGSLRKDLQAALDSPDVQAIVLDIDSPGGQVNGLAEMAAAIYDARGKKPVTAYVGGMGASAAYWLASAASEVVCSVTAELGSIGVICSWIDDTKAMEMEGLREIEFVSSQSPAKGCDPDNEDDVARMQARVDDLAKVFVGSVAKYRGVTPAAVLEKFGQGDVMVGQRAVGAGLADRLGDFESTVAAIAGAASRSSVRAALTQPRTAVAPHSLASAAALRGVTPVIASTATPAATSPAVAATREARASGAGGGERTAAGDAERLLALSRKDVAKLEARVRELELAKRHTAFDALLRDAVVTQAKISPAMAHGDWMTKLRDREDGVETLREFIANARPLVTLKAPKEMDQFGRAGGDEEFTPTEIEIAKNIVGRDNPEALRKHLLSLRQYKTERAEQLSGRVKINLDDGEER